MFVGAKGGGISDAKTGYVAPTQSSSNKHRSGSRGASSKDPFGDEDKESAEEK